MVRKGRSLPLKRQRPTRPNSPQLGAPEGPSSSSAKCLVSPNWRDELFQDGETRLSPLPEPLGSQWCLLMSEEAEFLSPRLFSRFLPVAAAFLYERLLSIQDHGQGRCYGRGHHHSLNDQHYLRKSRNLGHSRILPDRRHW